MNSSRRPARRFTLACLLVASLASGACARGAAAPKATGSNSARARGATAAAGTTPLPATPATPATPASGAVLRDVPEKIDTSAKYLFYLHGRIVETGGVRPRHERHGYYEYGQILQTLAARGFQVISEPRPADTGHFEYARKITAQVGRLLAAGVPARNVTVVGASKGGVIAAFVSTLLRNRDVNYVILAGCSGGGQYLQHKVDFHGRVLSIYDTADEFGGRTAAA